MCGLLFSNNTTVSAADFLAALDMMSHRGPDAQGSVEMPGCRLGHRRLAVIDADSRSDQPFWSRDRRHVVVFNGEIYNYRDLAARHAIPLRTSGDTEVLLELFVRHGPQCLSWLEGMFAFVIVDAATGEWFAARDRLGVKPLYICRSGHAVTIASEIAPILRLTGISRFDEIGVRQYRKLRTFFNGRTAYAGVEMFPAGHYMQAGKLVEYWRLPELSQEPPCDEELRQLVVDSVSTHLVADVPVGSYLSGGLDSTIIAALAQRPHTWTVGFPELNEFEWARQAARAIHSIHHEVLITADEFVAIARKMIRQRREPLSVPNEVLLFRMTSEVRKYNTVILSGEGADELFFGYDRVFRWAAQAETWDVDQFIRLYAYGSHDDREIVEDALAPFVHRRDPLDIVASFFQVAHLHGLLRRLDNATMACSVEARVPFVDYSPLIERMAGVSFAYRMHGGVVKAPLKRVFRDIVPASIIQREKVGFPVPLEALPLGPAVRGKTAMDRWLEFNLAEIGYVVDG